MHCPSIKKPLAYCCEKSALYFALTHRSTFGTLIPARGRLKLNFGTLPDKIENHQISTVIRFPISNFPGDREAGISSDFSDLKSAVLPPTPMSCMFPLNKIG